ncbi:MAG: PLD nuclease N-terminal domain-containing protein [Candidatus Dormibacteria bacterium]
MSLRALLLAAAGPGPRLNPAVLAPVVVIELGLLVYCLVDLARRERVPGGSKWPWALLILAVGGLGPVAYLLLGRRES